MPKAIIIGASSGIGRALAFTLSNQNYTLGLMARRIELLHSLQKELPNASEIGFLDISQTDEAMKSLLEMIARMEEVDLIIINSGTGFLNPELDWQKEKATLDVNVYGFCALATVAFNYFLKQKKGHLVGISSIGALRGNDQAPAYNASKAFMSNYLEGLRKKATKEKSNITVTDIKPGFVDTDMAKGSGKFWVAAPQKAAEQIYQAIKSKRAHAYITSRWKLIGWLLKLMPNVIYDKI